MIVVIAFFLPWMDGAGALEFRSFSGFDFARLVRNFEITADSTSAAGEFRATAIAIYLVPALAVNGAVLDFAAIFSAPLRRISGCALAVAAAYVILVLALLLALSVVPVNEFATVVGFPKYGFGLTASGALLLASLSVRELRSAATET